MVAPFRRCYSDGMAAVVSVIDTLFDRVVDVSVRVVSLALPRHRTRVTTEPAYETPSEEEAELADDGPHTFRSIEEILHTERREPAVAAKNTIMYARSIAVPVFRNPTVEFDSELGVIPYGEMVMMLEPRGRFYRVVWNALEGWVLKDDLADRAAYVYPDFTIGEENSVDSPNTAHVRAIIGDTFNASRAELPLQAGEYVLYKLWKRGKRIDWPLRREARVPGLWHKLLRGVPRIHIGVTPKVGDIMEYVMEGEVGHLAYVEAVFPDDTITVSEANFPDSGIYNERVLTREEWRELRPTFVSVL